MRGMVSCAHLVYEINSRMSTNAEIDICNTCLSNSLPFHSIDDLEFYFIFGNFNRIPSEEDIWID